MTVVDDRNSDPETPDPGAGRGALGSYGDEQSLITDVGEAALFAVHTFRTMPRVRNYASEIFRQIGILVLSSYGIILFMEGILAAEISLDDQRPAQYVFSENVQQKLSEMRKAEAQEATAKKASPSGAAAQPA